MSVVQRTASELIEAVGSTYRAIDIRSVAIRKDNSWVNIMAVVRLTYEDVDSARARLATLARRFPPVRTELLRIDSFVRPFSDWADLCSQLKLKALLRMGDLEVQLRHQPDLSQGSGYIQWGYSRIRSIDGRAWPTLTRDFELSRVDPLIDVGKLNQEANLLGYDDVEEAANGLCELNVSQRDRGCDFSVSLPVFANISHIRVRMPENRIDVEIERHRSFSDLRAILCVCGETVLVDAPFRELIPLSDFSAADADGQIVSAQGSVQVQDLDPDEDRLEVRLIHPRLGAVKKDSNYARMFIQPTERNILLGAVQQFCKDTTLDDLLARAYNVQTAKLKPSAAFELHVSWLLGMFGLSTIVLGEYERLLAPDTQVQRASIDILAASQQRKLLLIVSCILNSPKEDDIGNLRYAREILAREVFAGTGVQIIPMLFTSSMGCPTHYETEGTFDWVRVFDADGIKTLLELLRLGQESRFFDCLANRLSELAASSQPR